MLLNGRLLGAGVGIGVVYGALILGMIRNSTLIGQPLFYARLPLPLYSNIFYEII